MTLPSWTREPLVHFLIAGLLVFAFFAATGANEPDPNSRVIEVDREAQTQLSLQFERTMGRSPTDAELDAQIERYVRDEVLYREALRLGLDQNDPIVRRRLASKMDMAASATAETAEPGEETLRAWFEENQSRFASAELITFDQLYFSEQDAAKAAQNRLNTGSAIDQFGEPISLPASMDGASLRELQDRFGSQFSEAVNQLGSGENWQGPVPSGFGWHLVKVRERKASEVLEFEAVRDRVESDWRSATIAARKDAAYGVLRGAYRVEISR
ncbi:MAG: peptidylprolyl isomerase [Pseudomonadota bacterium]